MEERHVVVLCNEHNPGIRKDLIDQQGWHCLQAFDANHSQALIRRYKPLVGIVVLDAVMLDLQLASIIRLFDEHSAIGWIALISPRVKDNETVRRLVMKYCYDFHTLPCDVERLMNTLGHCYGFAVLQAPYLKLVPTEVNGSRIIATSPVMQRVLRQVKKIAAFDASVMLTGESGTGKELMALSIHRYSERRNAPFIAINCGAIPAALIQSELFGHEKGAFTGAHKRRIGRIEAADGGTVFLDEIGDLPLEMQVNLLRFLQEKVIERVGDTQSIDVNVRVIAATNIDLREAVEQQLFREDLYYRLNVIDLQIPPLRERREDIEAIALHCLERFSHQRSQKIKGFCPEALECMYSYDWPGNVRELINIVQRAVVMCDRPWIGTEDLGLPGRSETAINGTLKELREQTEQLAISSAMLGSHNNVSVAARRLGVSRATLYRLLEKYDCTVDQEIN